MFFKTFEFFLEHITCIVKLGLLIREIKTKRYFVSQHTSDRTKHILKKENVISTVEIFSEFLSIVITALIRNRL